MDGRQQQQTRHGQAPWWLSAVLAAADAVEQDAGALTDGEREQLAAAARRLYTAALPPGVTAADVARAETAIGAALFAGGSAAAAVTRSPDLQGLTALGVAAVLAHQLRTIPPAP